MTTTFFCNDAAATERRRSSCTAGSSTASPRSRIDREVGADDVPGGDAAGPVHHRGDLALAPPRRGLGAVDEVRDAFEIALYHEARRLGKPVFGICRGVQLLNVLEGGTLHLPANGFAWLTGAPALTA